MTHPPAHVGLIGLAVMGQNLARNIANHGFSTLAYNRTTQVTTDFCGLHRHENLRGVDTLEELVQGLERPRKIIIMVKAGGPVDAVIEALLPYLEAGDVIADGGNSYYKDTQRRAHELAERGIHFLGTGISGGEEGALNGPSIMPGGTPEAWALMQPVLQAIAAKDFNQQPCVMHVGPDAAGHYVKMVHNGIEYGVMQLMAEAYDLLTHVGGLSADQVAEVFARYNQGPLNSYLFEIAVPVLARKDADSAGNLVDVILDTAAQKGTGRWTAQDGLERGVAIPTIAEAVFARVLSSQKQVRTQLAPDYDWVSASRPEANASVEVLSEALESALYAAMLSSYAQGFDLIKTASDEEHWNVDLAETARIWEGGCIIRARILGTLHEAYQEAEQPAHMFAIERINQALQQHLAGLRMIVSLASEQGIPVAGLSTALGYIESMVRDRLPANLIQGLRDYFGAHTYQRTDQSGTFHTEWMDD